MLGSFSSVVGALVSWWGAFFVSVLDSSVLFVVPFANDALLIYLAARHRELFWWFALTMTAGSLTGAALTYWIGHELGHVGLRQLVSRKHLDRLKRRITKAGAGTLALAAILPPPFPLTPFILISGALDLDRRRFFLIFGVVRLVRFGTEATLARKYGNGVLRELRSDTVHTFVMVLVIVAVAGTVASAVVLWRRTRLGARC
jgi:membrane protein YqaA with SNARE-associated domain